MLILSKKTIEALNFAAHMHTGQTRKGADKSPYINHPIYVAYLISEFCEYANETIILSAILHDVVEDTNVSTEEIAAMFGDKVASIVAEVTDDKSLTKEERKQMQILHAPNKSREAKVVKLADKISNVKEIVENPPADWNTTRRYEYLLWSEKVVNALNCDCTVLNDLFYQWLNKGKTLFAK